jgi:ribonuclease BN (tRNA processing enzyme)
MCSTGRCLSLLMLVLLACRVVPAADADKEAPRTRVVLLGTGTPNADPDRMGPAVAIVVDDHAYLVDAGPGIVRRASLAARNGIAALAPDRLDIVFLTHLHSDHTVGMPDLMFTPWTLERAVPLRVFGPRGSKHMADHIIEAYDADIRMRIDGSEPANETGWQADVVEIEPGVIFEDERVRVTAFAVKHGSWPQAFGYRFDTSDRTIVVSGDAAPPDVIVEQCRACDVLVHEVYSESGFARRPPEWQRYHAAFHTSTQELAEVATRARPGLLVLYHQLHWGTSDADLLDELRRGYDGPVVSGRDLGVY